MREIKFRAFIDEEMIDADSLAFEEYAPLKDQLASEPCLMQFTGLEDKNGKEIYEADLLVIPNAIPRGDGEYDDGISYVDFKYGAFYCAGYLLGDICEDCEIIGNVYENPELLE